MEVNIIIPSQELIRASGKAHINLLYCTNTETCQPLPASVWQKNAIHQYMLELTCSSCLNTWYICTICDNAYSYFKDVKQLNRHCTRPNRNHPGNTMISQKKATH
jgi:hypothetical protein